VIRYDIRFRKLCLDYDVMIDRDCLRYDVYSKFKSLYRLWSVCPICLYSCCISTYVVHKRHTQGLYGKVFCFNLSRAVSETHCNFYSFGRAVLTNRHTGHVIKAPVFFSF